MMSSTGALKKKIIVTCPHCENSFVIWYEPDCEIDCSRYKRSVVRRRVVAHVSRDVPFENGG